MNWIQFVFLSLNIIYSSIGYLIYNYENVVPAFVLRIVKYGVFSYKGHDAKFMKRFNVPKKYYSHFYTFASVLSVTNLIYMLLVYFGDVQVNIYYTKFFQMLHRSKSPVSALASLIALSMITLQCLKRCYETWCMQVFSKSCEIYLHHYIAGWLFYLSLNAAIIGQSPLFCGNQSRDAIIWADLRTIIVLVPGIPIFLWAWREQHKSNIILANLRKDKNSGHVVTEEHKIPHGRLFENISSPHRYCEIIMYSVFFSVMQTKTFFFIFLWVLFNQIQTAMFIQKWYSDTFKNYPKHRYALFKGIL